MPNTNTNRRGYRTIERNEVVECECGGTYAWVRSARTGNNYRAAVAPVGQTGLPGFRFEVCLFEFHNCPHTHPVRRRTRNTATPADTNGNGTGALSGIVTLFVAARANLRYPRITFGDFTLALIHRGPNAGGINITDGRRYPDNTWYGRIDRDGELIASRNMTDEIRASVHTFAANPDNFAAAHGHTTGACCFCNRTLTDDRSTSVGYGPICAGHYGLAWGTREGAQREREATIGVTVTIPNAPVTPAPPVESGKDCSTCGDRHAGTCAEFAAAVA